MGELTAPGARIKQADCGGGHRCQTLAVRWGLAAIIPIWREAREAVSRSHQRMRREQPTSSVESASSFEKARRNEELVDVNEVIREMIVLLRSDANRHSISIRIELAEDLPHAMADRVQLQQVFMNLMLNASMR